MAEPLQTFVNSLLYRVYKGNTQRLNTNLKSLNSHAAFLVVLEEEKLIYVWIGSLCRPEDAALTNEIGEAVLSKDFQSENDEDEIPNLLEGSEAPDLLEAMLDILWSTKELYNSKNAVKQRRLPVVNSSVSVGIIERAAWSDTYDFQETSFAYTDSYGTLPRVTFAPISASTVAYVNTGDHWDVWFARAVPWQEIERVIIFLRNTVAEHLALPDNAFTKTVYLPQYIVIVRQGREGTLFKQGLKLFTDFEPTSKAIMRPEPAPRMKKDKKHIVEERKSAKIVATKDSGALGLGLGSVLGLGLGSGSGSDSVSSPKSKKLPRVASVGFWGVDEKPASPSSFWAPVSTKSFDKTVPPPPPGQSTRQSVKSVSKDSYEDKVTVPVGEVQVVQFSSKDAVVGMDLSVISESMLEVVDARNDNPRQRAAAIDAATLDAKSLIGYQVEIDDGVYAGVFVVAQVKKTLLMKKTLFRLRASDSEFWIRLRRNKKAGQLFRPLRRVVEVRFEQKGAQEEEEAGEGEVGAGSEVGEEEE